MIFGPDPTFILIFGIAVLLAVLSVPGLLGLGLALALPRSRRHVLARPWRYGVLGVLLLGFAVLGVLMLCEERRMEAEMQAEHDALNPRLERDLQLGELVFPAGSQVRLDTFEPLDWQDQPRPHGLESLIEAWLPQPQPVLGLEVDALELPLHHYFSRLRLARDSQVDGWPCAGNDWVEYRREVEERLQPSRWHFDRCPLVPGSRLLGVDWPLGSQVYRTGPGWTLRVSNSAGPQALEGMSLLELSLVLDADRALQRWDGRLAEPHALGDWDYPAGTRVRHLDDQRLLLSPTRDAPARNRVDGEQVDFGRSIVQARDGRELGRESNERMGVIDVWE
ncbi:hypothetical protein [Pseudomonas sp. PDM13]|uniref:hypothetical protein n=1 Tax=Pseudomonas sp. PDM13 TaxID=2769255 RepID=UPI0021DFFA24|nr:hypothetical protein [Pseudomonas sp. PDM13]MCU9951035.1 hypothetical protein [Pseudomonas sp. PDM13]